jgi:hypothetical protein
MSAAARSQESLPSRESTSRFQIEAVLAIAREMSPYLLGHRDIFDGTSDPKLDGGAQCAAAATFIKACGLLDAILADEDRWNVKSVASLYDAAVAVQEQQKLFLIEQTAAAKEVRRPTFQLRPELALVDGGYIAFWGNLEIQGGSIIGRGETPEAAFKDFDLAFSRTPEQQVQAITEAKDLAIKRKRTK